MFSKMLCCKQCKRIFSAPNGDRIRRGRRPEARSGLFVATRPASGRLLRGPWEVGDALRMDRLWSMLRRAHRPSCGAAFLASLIRGGVVDPSRRGLGRYEASMEFALEASAPSEATCRTAPATEAPWGVNGSPSPFAANCTSAISCPPSRRRGKGRGDYRRGTTAAETGLNLCDRREVKAPGRGRPVQVSASGIRFKPRASRTPHRRRLQDR